MTVFMKCLTIPYTTESVVSLQYPAWLLTFPKAAAFHGHGHNYEIQHIPKIQLYFLLSLMKVKDFSKSSCRNKQENMKYF